MKPPATDAPEQPAVGGPQTLKRRLGVSDAVFFILGNVIGIGIFLTPSEVASQLQNPMLFLVAWVVGGLIALAGAMSSAELGIMMPHAGGDYVFLKKTYGMSSGFLYGYLSLVFSYTGSIAAMATGIVHYQGHTIATSLFRDFHLCPPAQASEQASFLQCTLVEFASIGYTLHVEQLVAMAIIVGLTLLNYRGLGSSVFLQKFVTTTAALVLVGVGVVIIIQTIFTDSASWIQLTSSLSAPATEIPPLGALATAMIPIFFTYSGWNVTLYLAEDIKNPQRSIPISMIISIGLVTLIYLLFCFVLLARIPFEDLLEPGAGDLASRAWGSVMGSSSGLVIAFVIAFLIMGGLNTSILSGSRVYLAMARDGIFFSRARDLHPKYGTPSWSLWVQCIWACTLILIFRDFETILKLSTMIMVFLSMKTISCVFLLRWVQGDAHSLRQMEKKRGLYRALGYPYFPALYILACLLILGGTIYYEVIHNQYTALIAAIVTVLGYEVYFVWSVLQKRKRIQVEMADILDPSHEHHDNDHKS